MSDIDINSPITRAVQGHVAILTLNRPEARNAVNLALAEALEAAIDWIEGDAAIRAAILTANTEGQARPVFCAGADLKALRIDKVAPLTERGHFGGFVFRERTKPIVAAVDGMAVAGGCELALACDIIVATERSSFAMPEVSRNLFAGAGAIFRLPRAVGMAVALDMLLTTDPIDGQRAYQLGLVSRLAANGEAEALALSVAERIAEQAPLAVQWTRRAVVAGERHDVAHVEAVSAEALAALATSEDKAEGLLAFAEKRAPRWQGR